MSVEQQLSILECVAKQFMDEWFKENKDTNNKPYDVYSTISWNIEGIIDIISYGKLKVEAIKVENKDLQSVFDDIDFLYWEWAVLVNARDYLIYHDENRGDKIRYHLIKDISKLGKLVDSALSVINGNKELMEKLYAKLELAIKFNHMLNHEGSLYFELLNRVHELM